MIDLKINVREAYALMTILYESITELAKEEETGMSDEEQIFFESMKSLKAKLDAAVLEKKELQQLVTKTTISPETTEGGSNETEG